jgi:hypothetical protein
MKLIVIGTRTPPGLDAMQCSLLPDAAEKHFDNATETWTVTTADGRQVTAPVVVDARPSANRVIASHGVPNYFRIPGPDVGRQTRFVTRCLQVIERSGAARIEARPPKVLARRWGPVASRFHLSGSHPAPDDLYDGPATLTVGDRSIQCRVRLAGHLDAIDGRFHWQGTVFGALPDRIGGRAAGVTLTVEDRAVPARVVEQTPWGTHMIAGVGDPPFG